MGQPKFPLCYVFFRLTLDSFPFRILWPPSCSHWGSTRHIQAGNVTNHPPSGGVSEDLEGSKSCTVECLVVCYVFTGATLRPLIQQ